jgi:hypothetical protein
MGKMKSATHIFFVFLLAFSASEKAFANDNEYSTNSNYAGATGDSEVAKNSDVFIKPSDMLKVAGGTFGVLGLLALAGGDGASEADQWRTFMKGAEPAMKNMAGMSPEGAENYRKFESYLGKAAASTAKTAPSKLNGLVDKKVLTSADSAAIESGKLKMAYGELMNLQEAGFVTTDLMKVLSRSALVGAAALTVAAAVHEARAVHNGSINSTKINGFNDSPSPQVATDILAGHPSGVAEY